MTYYFNNIILSMNSTLQEIYSSQDQGSTQILSISDSLTKSIKSKISQLSEITTNISYNFKNCNLPLIPHQRRVISLQQDNEIAWLLGQPYTNKERHNFLKVFQNIIWISYRKGMKGANGDVGWGCMIRVSQMLMAQVIHRHLPKLEPIDIIPMFRQDPNAIYSFNKICQLGGINERWTSTLQVFNILKLLSQKNKYQIVFDINNTGLYIESPSKILSNKSDFNSQGQKIYPKLITISNRVGVKYIPEECYLHFEYLMKHQNFCGAIGGTSGQALYIVGFHQKKAIIFDPHYVQASQQCFSQAYFAQTPRGIYFNELCPSITLCYYIKNAEQYLDWARWMVRGWLIHQQNLVIDVKVDDILQWKFPRNPSSQQFQILL